MKQHYLLLIASTFIQTSTYPCNPFSNSSIVGKEDLKQREHTLNDFLTPYLWFCNK